MPYIPSVDPAVMQKYVDETQGPNGDLFTPNIAAEIPPATQQKMWQWLLQNYIWPQIQERMPYEPLWDRILEMARVELPYSQLFANTNLDGQPAKQAADQSNRDKARVSDTVVYDAIQRLVDITSFIAFKEGLPVQYDIPEYVQQPYDTAEYQPLKDRIKAGNCLLAWNSDNQDVKRKSRIVFRHHYQYGISFVLSDFCFKIAKRSRRNNQRQKIEYLEIEKLGVTFEPISLRKLWLNWRIPVYDMDMQPCPFFFEETPRFATLQNPYDPILNPFGYVNLDMIGRGDMIYTGPEMQSVVNALTDRMSKGQGFAVINQSVSQILKPEYSVEAKWTLFPVMPYDPETGDFEFRPDGTTPVEMKRFVMETWGTNITGKQVIIRLQENYYPKGKLCLYGSCHMPDLDSGAYSPSIGELLENHYREIVLCKEQMLQNKDLANNPPFSVNTASPAMGTANPNAPGTRIEVNTPTDVVWRPTVDSSGQTVPILEHMREQGSTSSKSVDAIMGKAMGARTSATEANNAYEASMSAITTDIDFLCTDIHGGYAQRVWDYFPYWTDSDLLFLITGQLGFNMRPEDFWLSVSMKANVGTSYVQKVVRQQNNRYILESSRGEVGLDRNGLWRELMDDMGLDGQKFVSDNGRDQQIQFATLQAIETYMGKVSPIDPDQDHALAIRVKSSFIKDRSSVWNNDPQYAANAQLLIQQIEQHQFFLQLQYQMQLVQQQMQAAQANLGIQQQNPPKEEGGGGGQGRSGKSAQTGGQVAQQGGGAQ